MKGAEERIKAIAERWFLTEPLLFNVYCTHKLEKNDKLSIPFQTGKMRLAYSPAQIDAVSDLELEDWLKAEALRIVLKHPYERVPPNANKTALGFASDVTVMQAMPLDFPLATYRGLGLKKNLSYEEYYRDLKDRPIAQIDYGKSGGQVDADSQDSGSQYGGKSKELSEQQKAAQRAALWQDDPLATEMVNDQIVKAEATNNWGSLSGDLIETIKASLVVKMDYKRILSSFRASVISERRELTRTRPNRRYEFEFMGSRYKFTTKLLVAVDVSGSVTSQSLAQFFSVINRFFKYGINSIDVIQFDSEVKEKVLKLKKARESVKIIGRGGTDFQPPIDYYCKKTNYDGLIVFTDGCAPVPKISSRKKILWILTDQRAYDRSIEWIEKLPNSRAAWIPKS
ncbi:MAG: hypothetical protein II610_07955 [Treponema sp.]|nr:hypothetical protein [Treponema sp.]